MPLGANNDGIDFKLKQVESELLQLKSAVENGQASPMQLEAKKQEYEALLQRKQNQIQMQQQLQDQAMDFGMKQLNKGQGGGMDMFGGNPGTGAAAMSAVGGAMAGLAAGDVNYRRDPNMTNKKDGFGEKHMDARAHVGGTILGGTLGYFGGPVGAAFAGPAVLGAHEIAEPTTRALINFGDSWGGAGGALMMDPIGTIASGKYGWGEIGKGFLLGPFAKLIK